MSKTIVKFENTNENLFEICDKWAETHDYKIIKSTESNRSYSKRQPIWTPLSVLVRGTYKFTVTLNANTVSIEDWIAFLGTETEISSASIYAFLPKSILRKELNQLLVNLGQGDKIVH